MTEPYGYDEGTDDGDDDGQQERYVQLPRKQIRALERDAKSARKTAEENAQLRRDLAFSRAGVELTEKQQKSVLANIDGDLTAEAIRAEAVDLGFLAPTTAEAPPAGEQAALERIATPAPGSADSADDDPIARLYRADAEGGRDALLAELARSGHNITPAS